MTASGPRPIPYDPESGRWLVDEASAVSRNDVLYTEPSPEPWEAMPTGGGDLSAMVRWDGSLHLHLTKCDAWGYQAPPDAPPGTRVFNTVSPGHVRLDFGDGGRAAARKRFRQRLDLYRGRVLVELGDGAQVARLAVWGHPELRLLVVEVHDPAGRLTSPTVELSEWRDTMTVRADGGRLLGSEVHKRAARVHLAHAGMDDHFPQGEDPLRGRGTAVVVASPEASPARCRAQGQRAEMALVDVPADYRIVVSAAVTESGDPATAALAELERGLAVPAADLRRQQRTWWEDTWSRSFVRVCSDDGEAAWLNAAYYVHLYTLGCTNRGPVPAKWDGGAGLMRGDERNWGISEWVQEVRFTFMPLYAANRLETARGLCDFYTAMVPYLTVQTERMWGLPGLWIPETVTPWGHAEDWVLERQPPDRVPEHWWSWDPATVPHGRFHHYNPYIGFLFTAGLEVCQHFLTWARYAGDETFLHGRAYPVLHEVCRFVTALLAPGDDGRLHLDPANALETWWMARDPADTLDGLRALLPQLAALAEGHPEDEGLADECRRLLTQLPEPSRGQWRADAVVEPDADVYAPAAAAPEPLTRVNAENPQLYRVYPFGLSGIGTEDEALARRTFEERICPLQHGWSLDAVWAARLGLGEQACGLLVEHARRFNRFRYGGWDSNDNSTFPGGLAAAPFLDAGGLSAFALQEILLQSWGGVIRIAPALCPAWSGTFRLRAEGGFLVTAHVEAGRVSVVEIESLLGRPCTVANPYTGGCRVLVAGEPVVVDDGQTLSFATERGAAYLLEEVEAPLAGCQPRALTDTPNDAPGLPGRDGSRGEGDR